MKNLTTEVTEEQLKEAFEKHGPVERVKKIKDYGFVHFEECEGAVAALEAMNGDVSIICLYLSVTILSINLQGYSFHDIYNFSTKPYGVTLV